MKKTALIICEYNPFHNGHLYHINKTRAEGAETIICIISGHFVQRGELALCDKSLRAEMAIRCGADLVLELPLPYVLSGARYFANGAAKVANALETDITLSFGALASLDQLVSIRSKLDDPLVRTAVSSLSKQSYYSYPRAVHAVVEEQMGETYSVLLRDPNSLLALEYIRAFQEKVPNCDFFVVKRDAAHKHDAEAAQGNYASAKFLRSLFYTRLQKNTLDLIIPYVPSEAIDVLSRALSKGNFPLRRDVFSAIAMTRLLAINEEQLRNVNGIRQGLEHRILSAVKAENDVYAVFDAVKSKRYTHAGIRQSVISAVLGIERSDLQGPLPYLRVLGMNDNGRNFLRAQKNTGKYPFVMSLSQAPMCRLRELDDLTGKLTAMCKPVVCSGDTEYRLKPFVLKNETSDQK